MRALLISSLLALGAALGCSRHPPDALLICHNANCAAPGTFDADDRLDALAASLVLEVDGRPAIDGVELDSAWDRDRGLCLFAHGPDPAAPELTAATALVAAHLARVGDASWNAERFYVKIELKASVDGGGDAHTPDEAALHADCVLAQFATLEAVALQHGRALTSIVDSADPTLVLALTGRPGWLGKRTGERFETKLEVDYDTAVPDGLDPDVLTVRWGAIEDHMRSELAARGKEVLAWGRDPSSETLADLDYLAPTFIGANDALLLRAWLSRGR